MTETGIQILIVEMTNLFCCDIVKFLAQLMVNSCVFLIFMSKDKLSGICKFLDA